MGKRGLTEKEKQQIQDAVKEWQKSGLSAITWCRENNWIYDQFLYRRRKYVWLSNKTPKEASPFVELSNEDEKTTGISLEIEGLKVYLSKEFDQETLSKLLSVLRRL